MTKGISRTRVVSHKKKKPTSVEVKIKLSNQERDPLPLKSITPSASNNDRRMVLLAESIVTLICYWCRRRRTTYYMPSVIRKLTYHSELNWIIIRWWYLKYQKRLIRILAVLIVNKSRLIGGLIVTLSTRQ